MKHKKIAVYAFLPAVLGFGFLSANAASAHGLFGMGGGMVSNLSPDEIAARQQTMFQQEANILGLSLDEVKEAWAQGKTMQQIAKEKGIKEETIKAKLKETQTQKVKSELQTLVTKGVITQAQADKRLASMQNLLQNSKGAKGMRFHRGFRF